MPEDTKYVMQLLSAIVDSSDDAIISKDLNGIITSWNKGAERIFGYTADETIGRSVTILIPPDRLDEESRILAKLKQGERVDHFETLRRTKSGRLLDISLTISPIRTEDGCIIGASKIARDITKQKRIESQIRRANSDLEQFAFSASHDLQEPLRNVKLYAEMLVARYSGSFNGESLKFLKYIREGVSRMEALVRDLLEYARSAHSENEQLALSDSDQILNTTVHNLSAVVSLKGARITSGPLPSVRIHNRHLQLLFQNLLSNALKYHLPGEPPEIHVTGERQGAHCTFSMRDNGIGIAKEYQEKIFDLFKRLHTTEEYSGTGLGLAICQRLVSRYDGRIWVESELGKGSTFRFTIRG